MRVVALYSLLAVCGGLVAGADTPTPKDMDRSAAYYNYAMGHFYGEMSAAYGNNQGLLSRAIDYFKQAIKADPAATVVSDELAELYFRAGRSGEAIAELQDRLKKDPKALDARRLLARMYVGMISRQDRAHSINQENLKLAIEQFQIVVEQDPKDVDSWLLLGRLYQVAQNPAESQKAFERVIEVDPGNEEGMTGLALVYSGRGDNQRAAEMLKKVAERNPNLRTLTSLADAYESLRDFAGAAEVLKRASELDPANTDLKRGMALDLLRAGKTDEALKAYTELTEEDPKDAESLLRLYQILRRAGDLVKAREALNKAKLLAPDNVEIRYAEVSLLDAEGHHAEAISAMKQLVDSTESRSYSPPERAARVQLLEQLGDLYRANAQYALAIETFKKIPDLDPDSGPRAVRQVIETYRQTKDFASALSEAEAGNQKYSGDRAMALARASLLAESGKGEQAAAYVKQAFGADAGKDLWFALAEIYEKAKNYPEMGRALDNAEKLVATDAEKVSLYFMRGAMYERTKQYDQAEREFNRVLEIDPENASVLNYFGYMLADRGLRLEEAHKMISRALDQDPESGAFLDSLGWVYYRMGRLEEAETYLRKAVQRESRDATVRDHLGDVLARQGKLREAITEWEASLKEWNASSPAEKDPAEIAKVSKKLEDARTRLAQESPAGRRKR
jgi:tetratricopeptide (TPR) repeat protein